MEIEAKFRIADDQTFPALLELAQLGPFRLEAAGTEEQHNVYFDTADMRLRAGRYGLRVRDLGGRRIATLKGETRIVDSVYERDEWEVDIGTDDRPESWPASEIRERVLALLGGAPLQPILTIATQRRHVYASRASVRVAELSLDAGMIHAGGRTEPFQELEIELLDGGERADIDALVALLRERFPLIPEDRSKLARGLALLEEASSEGARQ